MKKRSIIISICLILLCIAFTLVVKYVDVKEIGPNSSIVGLATINDWFKDTIGVNKGFYKLTNYMNVVLFMIPGIYALIGLIQLIKRKSFSKVDKELYILAGFYVLVACIYIFFEHVIINYRPVLIKGVLEASYPSSHTLASICVCGSAIIINDKLFNNKKLFNYLTLIAVISMFIIILGRVLSGYHWLSDIFGSIIISSTLLYIFNSLLIRKK